MWEKNLRSQLKNIKRLTVECKRSVLLHNGVPTISGICNIVEQLVCLANEGKQIILISPTNIHTTDQIIPFDFPINTSLSTSNLQQLYEVMFKQYGVSSEHVIANNDDLVHPLFRRDLLHKFENILSKGKVCILFTDNLNSPYSSLAPIISKELESDLLIILSDIDGIHKRDPKKNIGTVLISSVLLDEKNDQLNEVIKEDKKNEELNLLAISKNIFDGLPFVAIINGRQARSITSLINGEITGTLFARRSSTIRDNQNNQNGSFSMKDIGYFSITQEIDVREIAVQAKESSNHLRDYSSSDRAILLGNLALIINENIELILESNEKDLEFFDQELQSDFENSNRLKQSIKLTEDKLDEVVKDLLSLSLSLKHGKDPLKEISQLQLLEGLELIQSRVPIGVLLVISEGRPELLPHLVGLSIASGNSVIFQSENFSSHSNRTLFQLVQQGLENGLQSILFYNNINMINNTKFDDVNRLKDDNGRCFNDYYRKLMKGLVGMINSKEELTSLLKIGEEENLIDMVIPRGRREFVKSLKSTSCIKMMGVKKGDCFIFLHRSCDIEKAIRIVLESKIDDPSSYHSVECLLVDRNLLTNRKINLLIEELIKKNIEIQTGPRANSFFSGRFRLAVNNSNAKIIIELVEDIGDAIQIIKEKGSEYVNSIVTEDYSAANLFQNQIDSSFVFWNCSTRLLEKIDGRSRNLFNISSEELEKMMFTKFKVNSLASGGCCLCDVQKKMIKENSMANL